MPNKKEAKNFLQFLQKKWNYSRDLLNPNDLEKVSALKTDLTKIVSGQLPKDAAAKLLEQTPGQLERFWPGCTKSNSWAENIEVLFVALVVAFALRCYFVQPFKIPTDSMKPTLWGIYPESVEKRSPNILKRILDYAVSGKSYHTLLAPEDGKIEGVRPGPAYLFIDTTIVKFAGKEYKLWTDYTSFIKMLPQHFRTTYKKGEVITNFSVQAGDHIFVNKLSYHFRLPKQGEVFVFTTRDIAGLQNQTDGVTQYYIKRCVGTPGVTLRLEEPYLYSDGQILAHRRAFERIYSKQNGYNGYVWPQGNAAAYLVSANDEVYIPEDKFWAMGDNSANSLDSRYWKYVPRENLVGTALVVYWPITKRWGLIQ
ncbi:MAG: signal peptidase I [Verrucomicrobiales bacterium]|jgi:signal peptidase I|nr:signal peptidase I [Verrucomicrobiales bacterium]